MNKPKEFINLPIENQTSVPFFCQEEINTNITGESSSKPSFKAELTLTIDDVRKQALLRYGSVTSFGKKLGITHGLASRLLSGDYVPLKPSSIQKIADALNIDPIILTQIYDIIKFKRLNKIPDETRDGGNE